MALKKRHNNFYLTQRDREILDLVARFRLTTNEVLQRVLFDDQQPNAVTKVTARLCEHKFLAGFPLQYPQNYYRLGERGAATLGLPESRTRPLGPQSLPMEYGVLLYATRRDQPLIRLTPTELHQRFDFFDPAWCEAAHVLRVADTDAGYVQTVATGCKDETAARAVLGELERRAELVKAGVMTSTEDAIADNQAVSLARHFEAYENSLGANEVGDTYRANAMRYLRRLADECGFTKLADLQREALEGWLTRQATALPNKRSMSARSRNAHRDALVTFCNWCVENRRLIVNPVERVPKANEKLDPRRQRRALTGAELSRLLFVARLRPLAEFGRETVTQTPNSEAEPGKRKRRASWTLKPLKFDELPAAVELARERLKDNPTFLARQERLGIERALAYKVAVTTGLRRGELASLTVGQLDLDGDFPHVRLNAADEKNRQGNSIPLRQDVADELRAWVSSLRDGAAGSANVLAFRRNAVAVELPASARLLKIPKAFCKILNRDLDAAGIPKRDDRGRTIDVHALRHTFGTMLSKAGVSPRVAQAAMRHSSIDLTMNVYTDPRLLDVQGAVESLPEFTLTNDPAENRQRIAAGAETFVPSAVTPTVTPAADFSSVSQSTAVTLNAFSMETDLAGSVAATVMSANEKRSLSLVDNERSKSGRQNTN